MRKFINIKYKVEVKNMLRIQRIEIRNILKESTDDLISRGTPKYTFDITDHKQYNDKKESSEKLRRRVIKKGYKLTEDEKRRYER